MKRLTDQPKAKRTRRKSHHSVPQQYLGYSLQTTRFVAKLLQAEGGSIVSLEVFEDVGVETSQGMLIAEQDKSATGANPVADRAVGLWKTFANWVDAVSSGHLELGKTQFEIFVSHEKSGQIAQHFSKANSPTEAQKAIGTARDTLWGPSPGFPLRSAVSKSLQEYLTKVFESDQSVVCGIVQAFSLTSGSSSPQADLKGLLSKALVPPEIIDEALAYAFGWVKTQIDLLLEQRLPASISVDSFRLEMMSFVRKHDRRTILSSFAKQPSQEEIAVDLQIRTYVRQLELIECGDDEKIVAVRDYLQASVDRTQWSVKGWVNQSSFDEFESDLIRTWGNLKVKTNIELTSQNDVTKGKHLYSACSLHKAELEGLTVPSHFTTGSFHAISDKKELGWHPNYERLLGAGGRE